MTETTSMTEIELLENPEYQMLLIAKERIFDHPNSEHYAAVYVNKTYLKKMGYHSTHRDEWSER